jgi:4-amino-4-deoxy-L-arabinose transferase-like glycosyltransferase
MNAGVHPPPAPKMRCWREREFWLLALLALAIHGGRLTALSLRGEETRWARIAAETLDHGHWLTPTLQGETYTDRPPLGHWTIALSMRALGRHDALAARLPALLATVLTTLLVYAYARAWQSAIGAFASGTAYATFAQVLQFGGLAENEALFTLFLGGGLLIWHLGHERGWPPALYWSLGYAAAGLATLTKGVQGGVYFAGGVVLFLLARRRWSELFSWRHLLGAMVFAAVIAAWMLPFAAEVGRHHAKITLLGPVQGRVFDFNAAAVARHLVRFPFEFLACLLPWSPLLFVYLRRGFRRTLAVPGDQVWFLLACIAAAFPTCWFSAGARARYLMSIYPCVAPFLGLVIERALGAVRQSDAERSWRLFLRWTTGCVLAAVGLAVVVQNVPWPGLTLPALPWSVAAACLAASIPTVILAWRQARGDVRPPAWSGPGAVAAALGVAYSGLWVSVLAANSNNIADAVGQLKSRLPADTRLVSFGMVHHPFLYHYDQPIQRLPLPTNSTPPDEDIEYFCFSLARTLPRSDFPFKWEQIAAISCDRRRSSQEDVVVVGRRIKANGSESRAASRRARPHAQ